MADLSQMQAVFNGLMAHYGPQDWWQNDNRLHDLLSMVLIQQTTQHNAELALQNLQPYQDFASLLTLTEAQWQDLIRPAGFYKQKTSYILSLLAWLTSFDADFSHYANQPTSLLRQELLSLKGVGSETADAILLYIFQRPVFIYDLYARRFFERRGWGRFASYEAMRLAYPQLADGIDPATCQEWHAVIDQHGKAFSAAKGQMDEGWLDNL